MGSEAEQSRYIIFADESGDHGLSNVRSHGRAFVIALAIFERADYEQIVVPKFMQYKHHFFQDDSAVLHEREIRRGEGPFRRLRGELQRKEAEEELRKLLRSVPFSIVAVGINKEHFVANPSLFGAPYDRRFIEALLACLVAVPDLTHSVVPTEIVVDSRGKKEDAQLLDLVHSLTSSQSPQYEAFRFHIRFARKIDAEVGVEIADLIANPIARRVLGEEHALIPFRILEPKFLRHPFNQTGTSLIVLSHE